MPETKNRVRNIPSNGNAQEHGGNNSRHNRLATVTPMSHSRIVPNRTQGVQQRRDATDFTPKQEVNLKAGDLRMAGIQIGLTKLRIEMDKANKLLEEMCKVAQVGKEK